MRISDWSSDVCSSDLIGQPRRVAVGRSMQRRMAARYLPPRALDEARRLDPALKGGGGERAEGRRVGKESVSTCRSRGSPYHSNNKHKQQQQSNQHDSIVTNTRLCAYTIKNIGK